MKKLIRLHQQDIHKIVKKVIKEQEEISLQERGMKRPTPGKFIYKKWRKRDGEIVVKAFIEYEYSFWTGRPGSEQDKIEVKKYLPLCGNADVGINQEIMFDNIFIPFKPIVGVNKESGDFHTGSPKEKCIPIEDVNYVSLSEYTPPSSPEKEDEDRWWENEITDEMDLKYGGIGLGKGEEGCGGVKYLSYHQESNTCVDFQDIEEFDEWWSNKYNK